jgi:hypothetical protein
MKNPLGKEQTLFATPEDASGLEAWLENFSGHERITHTTAAFMAWNLAVSIIDEALKEGKLISTEE